MQLNRNPRWPPPQDRFTLDPMGKLFKCETKLYMIVHWMALYKVYCFSPGLSLKLGGFFVEGAWHLPKPEALKSLYRSPEAPQTFLLSSVSRLSFNCPRCLFVNGAAKICKERLVLLVLFFDFFVDKLNIYELNCH
jgi:hypothetical protein